MEEPKDTVIVVLSLLLLRLSITLMKLNKYITIIYLLEVKSVHINSLPSNTKTTINDLAYGLLIPGDCSSLYRCCTYPVLHCDLVWARSGHLSDKEIWTRCDRIRPSNYFRVCLTMLNLSGITISRNGLRTLRTLIISAQAILVPVTGKFGPNLRTFRSLFNHYSPILRSFWAPGLFHCPYLK